MAREELPEPWLRGPIDGVDPTVAPTLHALRQAQEDLRTHTSGLIDKQAWMRPFGVASLGFHLRHIAGSLDRLTTYLEGGALNQEQFVFLRSEPEAGAGLAELLGGVDEAIGRTSHVLRSLDVRTLRDPRSVGRQALPTTVIGLIVHLAEHTQRHVGQAITTCKLLKGLPSEDSTSERAERSSSPTAGHSL